MVCTYKGLISTFLKICTKYFVLGKGGGLTFAGCKCPPSHCTFPPLSRGQGRKYNEKPWVKKRTEKKPSQNRLTLGKSM